MVDFKDLEKLDENWKWEEENFADEGEEKRFRWYSARTYTANEDRLIETLLDRIRQNNLTEEVQEILSIKEYYIQEGEELTQDSPELPKRGFQTSKGKVWVQLKNGNFKDIRLVIRRPFKCFIFFKMSGEFEVFSKINSWMLGLQFLGFPKPNVVSEEEIEEMKKTVSKEIPSLVDYVSEKGYKIIRGKLSKFVNMRTLEDFMDQVEEKMEEEVDDSGLLESPTHMVTTTEWDETGPQPELERKEISLNKLKVNDFVYLVEMGAKGVVREIDLPNELVTVHINLFGRNQTIKCSPQQLREF